MEAPLNPFKTMSNAQLAENLAHIARQTVEGCALAVAALPESEQGASMGVARATAAVLLEAAQRLKSS